jgi:hypothetical protein
MMGTVAHAFPGCGVRARLRIETVAASRDANKIAGGAAGRVCAFACIAHAGQTRRMSLISASNRTSCSYCNSSFARIRNADTVTGRQQVCAEWESAPAAINRELRAATLRHPNASAVETPVFTLDAARLGELAHKCCAAGATQVDLTEMILSVLAFAGDREAAIPAWIRLPTACFLTVIVASVIATVAPVIATLMMAAIIGRDETAGATAIYPQAIAIDAPVLTTHATCVGELTLQPGVAPRYIATLTFEVVAAAFDRIATIMPAILSMDPDRWCKCCRRENKSHSQNCGAHSFSP